MPISILAGILLVAFLLWYSIRPFIYRKENEEFVFNEERRKRHEIGKALVQEYQKEQLKDAWR